MPRAAGPSGAAHGASSAPSASSVCPRAPLRHAEGQDGAQGLMEVIAANV